MYRRYKFGTLEWVCLCKPGTADIFGLQKEEDILHLVNQLLYKGSSLVE